MTPAGEALFIALWQECDAYTYLRQCVMTD
jgi:hypothetical protein